MIVGAPGAIMYETIEIIANRGKEVDRKEDRDQENIGTIWPPLNYHYRQRTFTGR